MISLRTWPNARAKQSASSNVGWRRTSADGTRAVAAHFVALALATASFGCSRSDPERELRSAVAAMAQAIEQREPAAFLDSISDDFARESGAFGKQDVKRLLASAYLRNEKISVNAVVTDVRIERRSRAGQGPCGRHRRRRIAARARPEAGISIRFGGAKAVAGRSTTQSGLRLCSVLSSVSHLRKISFYHGNCRLARRGSAADRGSAGKFARCARPRSRSTAFQMT